MDGWFGGMVPLRLQGIQRHASRCQYSMRLIFCREGSHTPVRRLLRSGLRSDAGPLNKGSAKRRRGDEGETSPASLLMPLSISVVSGIRLWMIWESSGDVGLSI